VRILYHVYEMEYQLVYYGIKAFIDHHNINVTTSRDALNISPIHYCTSLTLEYLFYRPYAVDAARFISNMIRIYTHCIIKNNPSSDNDPLSDDTKPVLTLDISLRKVITCSGDEYYFDRSDGYAAFRFPTLRTDYREFKLGFEPLLQIIFDNDWRGFDYEFNWILDDVCDTDDFLNKNHNIRQLRISNIRSAMVCVTDEWVRDARIF
jgi:hypothetical protein